MARHVAFFVCQLIASSFAANFLVGFAQLGYVGVYYDTYLLSVDDQGNTNDVGLVYRSSTQPWASDEFYGSLDHNSGTYYLTGGGTWASSWYMYSVTSSGDVNYETTWPVVLDMRVINSSSVLGLSVTSDNKYYQLTDYNPQTGAERTIWHASASAISFWIGDIAYDPQNGILYGITQEEYPSLAIWNTFTGEASNVTFKDSVQITFESTVWNTKDSNIYALAVTDQISSPVSLYVIDVNRLTFSNIVNTSWFALSDLALDVDNQVFYFVATNSSDSATPYMVSIDLNSKQVTGTLMTSESSLDIRGMYVGLEVVN